MKELNKITETFKDLHEATVYIKQNTGQSDYMLIQNQVYGFWSVCKIEWMCSSSKEKCLSYINGAN